MSTFHPTNFFDLGSYPHATLFSASDFVWDALTQIALYLKTQQLGLCEGEVSPQAYLVDPNTISIGKGTVVEAGAYIKGPCIIGENCEVRHGAYIRGCLIAGNNCVIGHDTEIKNAIFLNDVRAGHFAYVGDTVLGNDVNLGAGTKCANLRLDNKEVIVHFQKQRLLTGLRKFGAIIGDRSQIGCNAVLNPGSLLGKDVDIYPCVNVGGVILENHRIKNNTDVQMILK